MLKILLIKDAMEEWTLDKSNPDACKATLKLLLWKLRDIGILSNDVVWKMIEILDEGKNG